MSFDFNVDEFYKDPQKDLQLVSGCGDDQFWADPDTDDTYQDDKFWVPEEQPLDQFMVVTKPQEANLHIPQMRPSRFTVRAFMMPLEDGTGYGNFSFEGRRHLPRIYDTKARRILLCCGRQVEKSTLLGNRAICYSAMTTALRTLYVSPSATQTKVFSNDRIKEPIETSPLLRQFTTTMLSQNIFEKQFVNRSKITMRYAFLNADRCVVGDTRVYFADGSVASVSDVYARLADFVGKSVWAANPATNWVEPATLTGAVAQGLRPVFLVRVQGGAELTCTGNQPLLTQEGWKSLESLHVGDFVAVPRVAAHGPGTSAPVEEFRLVGYLLGDGSVKTYRAAALHNGDARVLEDFRRCARALGIPLYKEQDGNKKYWVHSKTKRQGFGGGREGYKKRLLELGVLGKIHSNKRVPAAFFQGDALQISNFLNALYATDGWASISNKGQFEIGYCSNSRGLLVDVQHLLLRFTIRSCISQQKKPSTPSALGAYTLSIRTGSDVQLFAAKVGIYAKEAAVASVLLAAQKVQRLRAEYDRIPVSYLALRAYLKNKYGLSTHTAWTRHHIQLRPGNVRDSVGREVLHCIGAKLGDAYLLKLSDSPLGWARIESVTAVGMEETFDLSIDGLENYLSDGFYVHNTRGIPASQLYIDEVQDILRDNIPVIEQCTSHAPDQLKRFVYSGTPKSLDNIIEEYRSNRSTQGEWMVPCEGCGYWNNLGEKNIGKKGPICSRCGKGINPQSEHCEWAAMVDQDVDCIKVPWESYRIPQLMVPWKIHNWDEVLRDYENYPRARFMNECLGISYESGTRPITQAQVRAQCGTHSIGDIDSIQNKSLIEPFFFGIDWGSGDNAYTVLVICTYVESRFRMVYAHRFVGEEADPGVCIPKIIEMGHRFNVKMIGADYGFGFGLNHHLTRAFGAQRMQMFQYMARINKKVVFDSKMLRWKAHRTEVMSAIFDAIKRGKVEFPKWEEFRKPFAEDFTNIYSEYNETLRMIMYDHKAGCPDDTFHAFVFCWLASMLVIRRPDIISPSQESAEGKPISPYRGTTWQG
jgi:intein/homing endonuclease